MSASAGLEQVNLTRRRMGLPNLDDLLPSGTGLSAASTLCDISTLDATWVAALRSGSQKYSDIQLKAMAEVLESLRLNLDDFVALREAAPGVHEAEARVGLLRAERALAIKATERAERLLPRDPVPQSVQGWRARERRELDTLTACVLAAPSAPDAGAAPLSLWVFELVPAPGKGG